MPGTGITDNLTEWTNQQDIWNRVKDIDKSFFIWSLFHKQRYSLSDLHTLKGWKEAEFIFLIDSEGHLYKSALAHDPRIHFWDSVNFSHPRFNTYHWWFDYCKEIELHSNFVSKLIDYKNKSCVYFFDSLLGTMFNRPHKNWVYEKIKPNIKNFLCGSMLPVDFQNSLYVPGGEFDTSGLIVYKSEQTAWRSCFIPYDIYNQTWYSLVCETRGSGDCFFTEKTAKPLMAKRLFILFAPCKSLKHLKSIGFKTFDTVIDESYDEIEDNEQRWKQAWNQVEYLLTQDPKVVYEKIQPILNHNHNLCMTQSWMEIMISQMRTILESK